MKGLNSEIMSGVRCGRVKHNVESSDYNIWKMNECAF